MQMVFLEPKEQSLIKNKVIKMSIFPHKIF